MLKFILICTLSLPLLGDQTIQVASDAWWESAINTNALVTSNLTTFMGKQYFCYINTNDDGQGAGIGSIAVGVRTLSNNSITVVDLMQPVMATDEHRDCAIALDNNGYIHVWFGMHGNNMTYYRSTAPTTLTFSPATMLGTPDEDNTTYPIPFKDASGNLYFIFRSEIAPVTENEYFYVYNLSAQTWSAAPGTGTNGIIIDGEDTPVGVYMNGPPQFDPSGHLWFSWEWATDIGSPPVTYLEDENVMVWNGSSFLQSNNSTAQTIPATPANVTPVIAPVYTDNLSPQNIFGIDPKGNVYIGYTRDDASDNVQVYVLTNYGGSWNEHAVTNQTGGQYASFYGNFGAVIVPMASGYTYVVYQDIFTTQGTVAYASRDGFVTSKRVVISLQYNPNTHTIPDYSRLPTTFSWLFQYSNDLVYGVTLPNAGPTMWVNDSNLGGTALSNVSLSEVTVQ